MQQLAGKVAVVTGGASGIGLALAERFAAEGMKVVLADVEEPALRAAEAALTEGGAEVLAVPTDVSVAESVEQLAARTNERFGTAHVVCNNAGVAGVHQAWEGPLSIWEWTLGVNLWGVVHGIRAFLPTLLEQGEGHIVNTASMAGVRPMPFIAPYVASKHAVVGLSESLFYELALLDSAVKVSVLCPTWVRTSIVEGDRNWPSRLGPRPETTNDTSRELAALGQQKTAAGLEPATVADLVVDAIGAERFWVFPEPELIGDVIGRFTAAADGRDPRMPEVK